jgi:hypothetical protein
MEQGKRPAGVLLVLNDFLPDAAGGRKLEQAPDGLPGPFGGKLLRDIFGLLFHVISKRKVSDPGEVREAFHTLVLEEYSTMSGRTSAKLAKPEPQNAAPRYWRDHLSSYGESMGRYIAGEDMTIMDLMIVQTYLRQWVQSPVWEDEQRPAAARLALSLLRMKARRANTREQLRSCMKMAAEMGMDPL